MVRKPQEGAENLVVTGPATLDQWAEMLGESRLAAKISRASGCFGFDEYLEPLATAAEVAIAFGVSERTIASWIARGCPGSRGAYYVQQILVWRASQPEPEPWHSTGNRNLATHPCSGTFARSILRVLRVDLTAATRSIRKAVSKAVDGDAAKIKAVMDVVTEGLGDFILSEDDTERFVEKNWPFM